MRTFQEQTGRAAEPRLGALRRWQILRACCPACGNRAGNAVEIGCHPRNSDLQAGARRVPAERQSISQGRVLLGP